MKTASTSIRLSSQISRTETTTSESSLQNLKMENAGDTTDSTN
jgi:hypothetical protein